MTASVKRPRADIGIVTWFFAALGVLMIPVTIYCAKHFGTPASGGMGDTSGISTIFLLYCVGFACIPVFFCLACLAHVIRELLYDRKTWPALLLGVLALAALGLQVVLGFFFIIFTGAMD